MICAQCGAQNEDGVNFCGQCGNPLAVPQAPDIVDTPEEFAEVVQQAAMAPAGVSAEAAVPAAAAAVPAAAVAATASNPATVPPAPPAQSLYDNAPYLRPTMPNQQAYGQQPYGAPQGMPQYAPAPVQTVPRARGCAGAAWDDIRNSPNWIKKVILLSLVMLVPILNFAVMGYAIRWSRELSLGENNPLPGAVFKKKEIATGFFATLIEWALESIAVALALLVSMLVGGLISAINVYAGILAFSVLSSLLSIAFAIFYSPFVNISIMRMGVVGYLESGFNFKKTFAAFKRNMGSAIGATWIPSLIGGLIASVVLGILSAILMGILVFAGSSVYNGMYYGHGYYDDPMQALSLIMGMGSGTMIVFIIMIFVAAVVSTILTLWIYRANGYWVARNAPEWINESDDKTIDRGEYLGVSMDGASASVPAPAPVPGPAAVPPQQPPYSGMPPVR